MIHPNFEDLSSFIDKELPDWKLKEIEEHIEICPICRERLEDLLLIDQGVRASYKEFDTQTFTIEVLEKIRPKPVRRRSFRLRLATIGLAVSLIFGASFGIVRSKYRENLDREKQLLISQHNIVSSGDMGVIFISDR
ncbi:MAG: zf-HC2 domain-containing protein [bacterium]|nr:zf-HC2 domain-containing protein [bacterium]